MSSKEYGRKRNGKLRQTIETMKEEYIRDLNVGFAEYKIEELSLQSCDSVVSPT
jgi:hypothetical protein